LGATAVSDMIPASSNDNNPGTLEAILCPLRQTAVVDVGANPIDGVPPYQKMLAAGLCHVIGFEPQQAALDELLRNKGKHEHYLPYVVGDGQMHTLNICRASGMTSLLEPDPATLSLFGDLQPMGAVLSRVPVQTRRLDDIDEIAQLDFLKIDIQGGELAVFQGGKQKLAAAVAIQTEVSFVTLYKQQPTLADVDAELRAQGFIPHAFAAVKRWPIAPCVVKGNSMQPLNQLLEADVVYVRDFSRPESMSDEQLKHLALVAQYCYGSYDLALRCIMLLEQRGALPANSQQGYLNIQKKTLT
jgi:FkbM family methyltransferase